MNRRTVAGLILLAWVSTLGWLVNRRYGGRPRETEGWPVPPGAVFQAIHLGTRQVGFRSLTVDTLAAGLKVTDLTTIDLPPLTPGGIRRTSARTDAIYSKGLKLLRWQTDLLTESGRTSVVGRTEGDSAVVLTAVRGKETETFRMRVRRAVILPAAVAFVIRQRGMLKHTGRLSVDVLDPLDLVVREGRYIVDRESLFVIADSAEYLAQARRWTPAHSDTVRAWRLERENPALPWAQWVDVSGMPVRTDNPLGASLDRSAFELVYQNYRARPLAAWPTDPAAVELVLSPPAEAPSPKPGQPPSVHREGAAGRDTVPTEGGWLIPAAAFSDSAGGRLNTPRLTAPDSLLDPVLMGAAPASGDAAAVARGLNDWVRRAITIRAGGDIGSAGAVLAARSGTRAERVVLLATLLRRGGLKAEPVWGVAHRHGAWQLASWVEVEDGGRRFAADPEEAQVPASTDRVVLGVAEFPRLLDLLLRAGQLRYTRGTETT
jgi:hypothetical protein